jgi:hypothetical protein
VAPLLRADLLPQARLAPSAVRRRRALLRHRAGLVRLRPLRPNRIHPVVAGFGFDRSGSDRSGSDLPGPGRGWLAGPELPAISRAIVTGALPVTGRPGPADRPGSTASCASTPRPARGSRR